MLTVGKRRLPRLGFVAGDALQLPYGDASFDAVTISFGLRNVEDTAAALHRDATGHQAWRGPGRVRVLHPGLDPAAARLRQLPGRGHPPDRPAGVLQPGGVRVPGRVDPGLARPGEPGRADRGGRLARACSGATCPTASSPCTERGHDRCARRARGPGPARVVRRPQLPGQDPPRLRPHRVRRRPVADPPVVDFLDGRVRFEEAVLRFASPARDRTVRRPAGRPAGPSCLAACSAGADVILGGRSPPTRSATGSAAPSSCSVTGRPRARPTTRSWSSGTRSSSPCAGRWARTRSRRPSLYSTLSAPDREAALDLEGYVFRRSREAELPAAGALPPHARGGGLRRRVRLGRASSATTASSPSRCCSGPTWPEPTMRTLGSDEPDGLAAGQRPGTLRRRARPAPGGGRGGAPPDRAAGRPRAAGPPGRHRGVPALPVVEPVPPAARPGRHQPAHRQGRLGPARGRGAAAARDQDDHAIWPGPTWTTSWWTTSPTWPTAADPRVGSGWRPGAPTCCSTTSPSPGRPAGPIELTRAGVEIDFDIESAADGRIYLWGFVVSDGDGPADLPRVQLLRRPGPGAGDRARPRGPGLAPVDGRGRATRWSTTTAATR